jgi:hypothetical protein
MPCSEPECSRKSVCVARGVERTMINRNGWLVDKHDTLKPFLIISVMGRWHIVDRGHRPLKIEEVAHYARDLGGFIVEVEEHYASMMEKHFPRVSWEEYVSGEMNIFGRIFEELNCDEKSEI